MGGKKKGRQELMQRSQFLLVFLSLLLNGIIVNL
jgi:hypothetical protein